MMNNKLKIIEWLSVCPEFEISQIEEHVLIDKSLIWGKLPHQSFEGVTFAALKFFLVDSYTENTKAELRSGN